LQICKQLPGKPFSAASSRVERGGGGDSSGGGEGEGEEEGKRDSEGKQEIAHVQQALVTLNREMVEIKQTLKLEINDVHQALRTIISVPLGMVILSDFVAVPGGGRVGSELGEVFLKVERGQDRVQAMYTQSGKYAGQWYACRLVKSFPNGWIVAWADKDTRNTRKQIEHIRHVTQFIE
jgi:hypothetical protein